MNQPQSTTNICPTSLRLLGDYWTLRIISALSKGELRYCELQRTTGHINPVTLTAKLRKLEAARLIERREFSRTDVLYRLTSQGRAALPVLVAVDEFSRTVDRQFIAATDTEAVN
ncbi:MAG: helix-turn-helix domain-containing protein [Candidatus Saccharimonadales bacterium]